MRSNNFSDSHRVIILAPTLKDAEVTESILKKEKIYSLICRNLQEACVEIEKGADAAIIMEEAILSDRDGLLETVLKNQPAWSDFPLIVLIPPVNRTPLAINALRAIGNMTMISRPLQIATLVSTVQAALRDRKRQYSVRDHLIEREAMEQSAREAREYLELMVESARDFIIISMDVTGRIVSWNRGAQHTFGYDADEVIGEYASLIFTPEDRAAKAPEQELETAARNGRATDERWHMRKNGDRFYASGTMAAMYDADHRVRGFIKIARDVTDQKQTEEALIEARNAAEAANVAKTEFLANMSHEIRTPMNAVIGLSNLLASSQPLTPRQAEFIKTLQLSADSLLSLINDLLDIAKIEARTVELEQIPFSLHQLIDEIVSMMAVRAQEKNLFFDIRKDGLPAHRLIGDPTRLRQILVNLCSNAVKFTERGGITITLNSENTDIADKIIVSIAVTDTGIGISQDKVDTIFEKFIQADTSINRKYGGTGLGLAITKTLTEIMGGQIKLVSQLGVGSTFTITLPFSIASNSDIHPQTIHFQDEI